nr:Chain L, NPAC [Homo sapiens]
DPHFHHFLLSQT